MSLVKYDQPTERKNYSENSTSKLLENDNVKSLWSKAAADMNQERAERHSQWN